MRQTMNILLALSTAPLGACGDDAPTATTAESPGLFDALLSRMGGVVVPTTDEDLFVEIIPEVDGKISALVLDEDGEIQQGGAAVQVQVAGNDGTPHPVTLQWDAVAGRYVGQVEGDVELSTGPMAVTVTRDGEEPAVGQVPMVATAPTPTHGGRVVVAGEYAAEVVPAGDGTIHAYVDGPEVGAGGAAAVQVEVQGTDGAPHPVVLAYDADAHHYVGRLEGEVRVAPGPLGFTVIRDGRPRRTRLHRVVAVGPQHGGDVVVAGEYAVEVVPSADGTIDAWVVGEEPVADGAEVVVTVGRERRPVTLVWSADAGHFVGAVDADVRIARAPIGVAVVHGGVYHHGAILPRYTVAVRDTWGVRVRPSAEVRVHGHPHGGPPGLRFNPGLMKGHGRVDIRGPHVDVRGPSAMVRVHGPGGHVRVRGPSGMVSVRGPGGHARIRGGMVSVRGGGMGGVRIRGGMGMN
ncbi:MAG: hypothetical protein CMN30_28990 [Sandaracinus sp.]|nr:hypothetical protein [Sandaracinus sp.]